MFKEQHKFIKPSRLTNKVNIRETNYPFQIVEFLFMLNFSPSFSNLGRESFQPGKKEKPSKRTPYLLKYREGRKSSEK